jgi:DNA polymerase (family 10)
MDKKEIAAILEQMGTILELQGGNPFKSRAYHTASRAVEGLADDIRALVESGEILEVPGIGKSISVIIGDLVTKGRSHEYDEMRSSIPAGLLEMLAIPGVGPKKVKFLYDTLKISSLAALEQAAHEDRLSTIKGFGAKTQQNILKGIESVRKRSNKFLYAVALDAASPVFSVMKKQKGVLRAEVGGSLRRRKEVIGDIDIVLSAADRDRARLMQKFVSHPEVLSIVAQGETKSSVVLNAGINCDLRIVDDREYPFALNYFTGSKEHNVEMRSRARRYGWSLNEYGFSVLGQEEKRGRAKRIVRCREESDIYKALDLAYVPPELRENMGEMQAAEKGELPSLVTERDIRGTFHCHTTYSDGTSTLTEMVSAAKKRGWEYFGIADHSKIVAYARGLTEDRVHEQMKEIDALNAADSTLRVLKGTECDILVNGELDWSDRIMAGFDYVVASVHSGFSMSEREMTRRIIKALKNRYVTMLGHPTGRVLLSREGYPVNMVEVIQAAADYGKVIEINGHPNRLDLDWRLCKHAKEKGVTIAINPDAHNVNGLDHVNLGVGIARKGWLEPGDVLNTMPLQKVLKYLRHS